MERGREKERWRGEREGDREGRGIWGEGKEGGREGGRKVRVARGERSTMVTLFVVSTDNPLNEHMELYYPSTRPHEISC